MGAYNSSKWAIEGFLEALRFEVKPFGIDVINIEPGIFKTKIFTDNLVLAKDLKSQESPYATFNQQLEKRYESMLKRISRDPKTVSQLVVNKVVSRQSTFRTVVGFDAKIRYNLRRFLPFFVYEWLLSRVFRKVKEKP